jgi:glycine betaine/proline transport system ATP-binding protein
MTEARLICRNIWKIFGPRGAEVLTRLGPGATPAAFSDAGHIAAVRAVDLVVETGEICVIMGLSGSGKSTLVRCLSRLIEPTAGEILFDGRDLLRTSETEMMQLRRHRMGMVFQHFGLLPHLTVLQNVAFPLDIQGMAKPRREAKAREMIALVGLAGREDFFPRQLSGGQQQRVGIARSLAADPELWFLDEPFSALDPLIRSEMQDEFLRLQEVLKKTIVFITHDFDEAIRLATRIAIMKDGAVEQWGSPEDLVLRPATPYVREFTRAVPRAKVVRVGSVMEPGEAEGPAIAAAQTVAEAAPLLQGGTAMLRVTEGGRTVGRLRRETVVDLMLAG